MKSFLNYFASEMIFLNVSPIAIIPQNDTFLYKGNAFLKVNVSHNFTKYFCGARVNEIVNNCPAFAICYLWVIKKPFALQKNR